MVGSCAAVSAAVVSNSGGWYMEVVRKGTTASGVKGEICEWGERDYRSGDDVGDKLAVRLVVVIGGRI
jgi:hypothetical protein